jgi:spermidine dehydrogenase
MAEFGGNGKSDGITRRDFLDGVAISAAGLAAAAAAPGLTGAEAKLLASRKTSQPLPPGYYPPTTTGLKGQTDAIVRDIVRIDGRPNPTDVHSAKGGPGIHAPARDTGEAYDCVVVGAGASGLAAAKFYQDRFGPNSRILVLDAMADFGGHSARNEFHIPNAASGNADVMILRNGGTVNLDSIGSWDNPSGAFLDVPPNQAALDILDFCGVDVESFPEFESSSIPDSFGLRSMLLFPAADWGADTLTQSRFEPSTAAGWTSYVNRLPYSQAAKDAIVRIQTEDTDWITLKHGPLSDEEKLDLLTRITYKQWLMEYVGAPEEAIVEYQRGSHGLLGAGAQAVSAIDRWLLGGAGFPDALGLPDPLNIAFPGVGRTPQMSNQADAEPSILWPDGNSSLLRLLISKLIPESFPDVDGDRPNQENIVKAICDYTQLDQPDNNVRIRLNSLVYRVRPGDKKRHNRWDLAEVDYIPDGEKKGRRVHAKHVVMACWNRVTAHILKGLHKDQVENLCYARKVPLIYGRAGLNNWRAFADAKISSVSPRGSSLFWDSTSLAAGASFGTAYGPTPNQPPEAPATLSFQVVPTGHTTTPQLAAYEVGRQRLLEMSFQELEDALIDVLDRSVNAAGGDFEPERDIHSLMVNRWNYGYAHEFTSVWDPSLYGAFADQPHTRGRVPFRNVAIANSDAQAFAYTHSAIQEGFRSVQDLPEPSSATAATARRARAGESRRLVRSSG